MKWNKQLKKNLFVYHWSGNWSFSTWWNSIIDILVAQVLVLIWLLSIHTWQVLLETYW